MKIAKIYQCCGDVSSFNQDSVWSWFICLCTAICMLLTLGLSFALGVLFPVLMDSFSENRERTAWVSSIIIGFACMFSPVMSAFLNKFGIRIATILGCLLCSTALAAGSFAKSLNLLYITFSCLFGLGISLIYVTATVISCHYFDKRRSVALGIITGGQGLGTMILGPSLQALVDVFDWRNTFRVFAGILALTSLTGCFLHKGTSPTESGENRIPSRSSRISFNLSLLKNSFNLVLIVIPAVSTFSRIIPYVHIIKYCDDLGISADKSSTLYLFLGIFATLGRLGAGLLCNLKRVKPRVLFQVVAFIMGSCTMLLVLAKAYGALVAYVIVFSVADGMMITAYIIYFLNSMEESKRTSAFGYSMLLAGTGALAGPPLSGFMADYFGNYNAAFLMGGGVGIFSSLVPFLLLCLKQESETCKDVNEPLEDLEQSANVDEVDLNVQQEEIELVTNTGLVRKAHHRPASLAMAMESPV